MAEDGGVVVDPAAKKVADDLNFGMLKDYVAQLEEQKRKLLLALKEYKQKYEQQKNDQSDIYYYLNKKLDENYETIVGLEEQILVEQADRESNEKNFEKIIEDLKTKLVNEKAKYTGRIHELEEKISSYKEFSEQKANLDKNLENLMITLEEERKQFREYADEMERRAIQEKEKMRHELEVQLALYQNDIEESAIKKLSTKTRETLEMNKFIKSELRFQSKQADKVLEYNQKVLSQEKKLRQELELSQESQKEMQLKFGHYQRLIKQLNENIEFNDKNAKEKIMELENVLDEKVAEIETLRSKIQDFKQKAADDRNQLDGLVSFLARKYQYLQKQFRKVDESIADRSTILGVEDISDRILCELVRCTLEKYPERFYEVFRRFARNNDDNQEDRLPSPEHYLQGSLSSTGIQSWDHGRGKMWWKHGDDAGRTVSTQTDFHETTNFDRSIDKKFIARNSFESDKYMHQPSSLSSSIEEVKSLLKKSKTAPNTPVDPLKPKLPNLIRQEENKEHKKASVGPSRRVVKLRVGQTNDREHDLKENSSITISGRSVASSGVSSYNTKHARYLKMSEHDTSTRNITDIIQLLEKSTIDTVGADDSSILSGITISPRLQVEYSE